MLRLQACERATPDAEPPPGVGFSEESTEQNSFRVISPN